MSGSIISKIMGFLNLDSDEDAYEYEEESVSEEQEKGKGRKGRLFALHSYRQDEILVFSPPSIEEAKMAADSLKGHCPVVVNLRTTDSLMSQRVIDFISGITYALDGHMQKLGEDIFLFTPANIMINNAVHAQKNEAEGEMHLFNEDE